MKNWYLILAAVGLILPYLFFVSFLLDHGFDVALLIEQHFANQISTFFAVDLIISILVFWVYLARESRRIQIASWWLFILASLTVGLSFALPLFLYVRQARVDNEITQGASGLQRKGEEV